MSHIADWLLMIGVLAPIGGFVFSSLVTAWSFQTRSTSLPMRIGMLIGCLAYVELAGCLRFVAATPTVILFRLPTWLIMSEARSPSIVWEFRADFFTAAWVAVIMFLSVLVMATHNRDEPGLRAFGFQWTACLVSLSSALFVLSGSLIQSLFFWNAISVTTLAMILVSSSRTTATQSIRMVRTGLLTDIVFVLAILLIVHQGAMDNLDELFSADGLELLHNRNPQLPGLIGSLLIVGAMGRCGLFPFLGWHRSCVGFHASVSTFVYAIGYVPSAIWMMLKCLPILLPSEEPMALLGGLGALGAAVGAFVACGQTGSNRLACLIAAQSGIMLAALGSGLPTAASWCVVHQISVSGAAFVLFAASKRGIWLGHCPNGMIWIATLSLAGVFLFAGGWSQQSITEMLVHPARWELTSLDSQLGDDDSERSEHAQPSFQINGAPRWGWLFGLWIARGITAYAATLAAFECAGNRPLPRLLEGLLPTFERNEPHTDIIDERKPSVDHVRFRMIAIAVNGVGSLLLIVGLYGWVTIMISITDFTVIGQIAFSQLISAVGIFIAWQSRGIKAHHWTASQPRGPISRLSHHALYIDQIESLLITYPLAALAQCAKFTLDFDLNVTLNWMSRLPAWIGREVEHLYIDHFNFDQIVILLGTAALLLTLVLIN